MVGGNRRPRQFVLSVVTPSGRNRAARWSAVLAAIALLAALPAIVRAWPAPADTVGAARLLQRITGSTTQGYSGLVQSDGGLSLPVTTSQFGSVSDLLGGSTTQRVWWRSSTDYRADALAFSGEVDTIRHGDTVWTWNYERNRASLSSPTPDGTIRLPQATDLLPPDLGRRLLSQADAAEVTRLPAARVAGHTVPGLRLRPADSRSTLSEVDVWADAATGLPVRVVIPQVIDTRFLDLTLARPAPDATVFAPPEAATIEEPNQIDLAAAVDRFGGIRPPGRLAGLDANPGIATVGAAKVYGRGVTEMAVGALPGRLAPGLRDELAKAPGAVAGQDGSVTLQVGPLSVLVGPPGRSNAAWVLVGTLTPATLQTALTQLPTPVGFRR